MKLQSFALAHCSPPAMLPATGSEVSWERIFPWTWVGYRGTELRRWCSLVPNRAVPNRTQTSASPQPGFGNHSPRSLDDSNGQPLRTTLLEGRVSLCVYLDA